jgi:hypothetical protein
MAPRKPKQAVIEETANTCKSCKHAFFGELTQCRRYPPVPSFDVEGIHVDSCWPVVHVIDFCGEFNPKLAS